MPVPLEAKALLTRGLVCAAAGKNFSQDAVGGGVEFCLEFAGGAAGLFHQGWIEQQGGAVNERAGSAAARKSPRISAGFFSRELFVEREITPKVLRVVFTPFERLPERDEKLLTK